MTTSPRIQVSLNQKDFEIIEMICKQKKISKSSFIKKIMENWLEKNKKKFFPNARD